MQTPELTPFTDARPRTFVELLCDGVTARKVASFTRLLELHARLQAERPEMRVLATLDDLGQACYTSGHGADYHGLNDLKGHDLSGLSADAFEDGEHKGYLSTPSEFSIRLANLRRLAAEVELDQVAGKLVWETDDDANDIVSLNRDPDGALDLAADDPVLFLFAPALNAADAIAAFPNGYFSPDLNPMQNHALARHLEARYGLAFFGVGARLIGFRRAEAMAPDMAETLAVELVGLYSEAPSDAARDLARLISGRDWVLLRYTEE